MGISTIQSSRPANVAWGKVAFSSTTAAQNGVTTLTDLSSLTATFTADASRRYRTTLHLLAQNATVTDVVAVFTITDPSNTVLQQANELLDGSNGWTKVTVMYVESGISGSITRKGRTSAGTAINIVSTSTIPAFILVEDIGPA